MLFTDVHEKDYLVVTRDVRDKLKGCSTDTVRHEQWKEMPYLKVDIMFYVKNSSEYCGQSPDNHDSFIQRNRTG